MAKRGSSQDLTTIGLDLAWKVGRPSGVSVARWSGGKATLVEPAVARAMENRAVLELVERVAPRGPCIVAIDCPLEIPNATGMRPCDRLLARLFRPYHAGPHPANRTIFLRRAELRGEQLAHDLRDRLGFSLDPRAGSPRTVIEVYPHPATVVLFDLERILPYKAKGGRSLALRQRALADLQRHLQSLAERDPPLVIDDPVVAADTTGLRGKKFKEVEDALDSLLCTYVGLLYGLRGHHATAVFGDQRNGHIVVPMTPAWWRALGNPVSPDVLYEHRPEPPNP